MTEKNEPTDYSVGNLSQLIAQKSKNSKQSPTKTSNLDLVFNDPKAKDYENTPKELLSDADSKTNDESQQTNDRKITREKSKLVKIRQKEKTETGNRTVFVGNLSPQTTKKDILKFFKKYGDIETVRFRNIMRKDITKPLKASAIKQEIHPLCKSVNAYILFKDEKNAQRALKRNGKELLGNHLRVDIADSVTKKEPNRKCSIFIGNVPFDAAEEEIRQHFSSCGTIVNVRLIKDRETRLGKGFGYVEFESIDGVSLALRMDGHVFGKKKLRVQRCTKGSKTNSNNTKQPGTQKQSWAGMTSSTGKLNSKVKSQSKKSTKNKLKKPKKVAKKK